MKYVSEEIFQNESFSHFLSSSCTRNGAAVEAVKVVV